MTKREGAILSAYTGFLLCNFNDLHSYVEEIMGHPVFTHEFPRLAGEIKEKSKSDFLKIMESQTSTN